MEKSKLLVICLPFYLYVKGLWKTNQIVTFGILRNTNFKYWNHCGFLELDSGHAIDIQYNWNSPLASVS